MTHYLTALFAPVLASSLLFTSPAMADHGHRGDQRYESTRVFVGGAGDRDLAKSLRGRIYPHLRGDMRPARKAQNADIHVRVKEVAFEPVFLPVKRKVKGERVKVKERLRVRYAYQVTILNNGRPIDRFMVEDLAAAKVVYRKTHSAYEASYRSGYRGHGKGPQNGMRIARAGAINRVEGQALNRVAHKINRRLMTINAHQVGYGGSHHRNTPRYPYTNTARYMPPR